MKKIYLFLLVLLPLFSDEFNVDAILQDESKPEVQDEIKLKKFTKDATKSYKKLKKEYYDKYEYVPPSKSNSSAAKSGFCFSSYIKNEGDRNFCLAFAKNDKSFCFNSNLTSSQKNICLGFCFDTSLSKADKAFCQAIKHNNINYCYDTNLKGTYRIMCLGRFNKSNCYTLNNEQDKYMCLGISLY